VKGIGKKENYLSPNPNEGEKDAERTGRAKRRAPYGLFQGSKSGSLPKVGTAGGVWKCRARGGPEGVGAGRFVGEKRKGQEASDWLKAHRFKVVVSTGSALRNWNSFNVGAELKKIGGAHVRGSVTQG